jgi:hypothetical protein
MKTLQKPPARSDGTCSACIGGWQCKYHQQEGVKLDRARAAVIASAALASHRHALDVIIATCQLESDECGTATRKAERILEER